MEETLMKSSQNSHVMPYDFILGETLFGAHRIKV